jgi:hypothetical protein
MEPDQRVCPRCGKPAGEYRFCEACRAHIDSLTGIPAQAGADAGESAAQVMREVLRLEEALAAVSKGISERIAAAAATGEQLHPEPLAPERSQPGEGTLERFPPAGPEERLIEATQPPHDVARLEEVLTPAPRRAPDPVPSPPPEGVAAGEAETEPQTSPPPAAPVEPEARIAPPPAAEAPPLAASRQEPQRFEPAAPAGRRDRWIAAICGLCLVGLLLVLLGRRARRGRGRRRPGR